MKIILEPESEEEKKFLVRSEYIGVTQFVVGLWRAIGEPIHKSVICNKHELLGLLEMLRLDIERHKDAGTD
jgi:hypothetical protein